MNLDEMMKDASISDLSWQDGETYEPGTIDLDVEQQLKLQDNKSIDQYKKEELLKNTRSQVANDMKRLFMAGNNALQVKKTLMSKYVKNSLPETFEKDLKAHNGLTGTILVDCSAIENYNKIASKFKQYNMFAIKCNCNHKAQSKKSFVVQEGNFDSLFKQDNEIDNRDECLCHKTGLPVLEKLSEFTLDNAISILQSLINDKLITHDFAKQLLTTYNQPMIAVKRAFEYIFEQEQISKQNLYKDKINVENYKINPSEYSIDIKPETKLEPMNITNMDANNVRIIDIKNAQKEELPDITKKNSKEDVKLNNKGKLFTFDELKDSTKKNFESLTSTISAAPRELEIDNRKDVNLDVQIEAGVEVFDLNGELQDSSCDFLNDSIDSIQSQDTSELEINPEEYIDNEWFSKSEIVADAKKPTPQFKIDGRGDFSFDL